jgi:hypothetical protein
MERKRLLVAYGVVTILVVAFIMVLLLSIGQKSPQPEVAPTPITVSGTLACLPHKNTAPGQPQTLECAIGLRTNDGRYYALKGLSSEHSQTSFETRVYITGSVVPPPTNTNYDTVGDITVSTFEVSPKK